MTDTVVYYRFRVRGGLAAALATVNEVPLARELVIETDTGKAKIGDGVTSWNALEYWKAGAGILTVTSAPSNSLGADGEYAIFPNSGNPILYGPKAGGVWPAGVSLKGPTGSTGPTGSQGPIGPQGLSAYQVAVANGFGGTAAEWLASLIGAQGPQGEQGPPGISAARRVQTITSTPTGAVTCDWASYDEIRVTLTTDTTFTFAGALDGQGCILKVKQDATGGRLVNLPASARFNAILTAFSASTAAGRADLLGFRYDGDDARYDFVSLVPGIGT